MPNVKTITATTTESAVEFNATYQFMWFRNLGENDCYVSDHSGIVANADDVTLLKAGEVARLTLPQSPAQSKAYIKATSGSNTVEVHAQNFSDCPFKKKAKGGEQITVESLIATENTTYTAPSGTAYSPVTVNVSPNVGTKNIMDNGTYIASSDNLDGYSSVTVNVPAPSRLPSGYTELDYVSMTSTTDFTGFDVSDYSFTQDDIIEVKSAYFGETRPADGIRCSVCGIMNTVNFLYYTSTIGIRAGNNNIEYYCVEVTEKNRQYTDNVPILLRGKLTGNINGIDHTAFPMRIGYSSTGTAYNPLVGRIYYVKIMRVSAPTENMMMYEFIPCKRNLDNKIGFYEIVNGVFYSSTTGTEFVAPASI